MAVPRSDLAYEAVGLVGITNTSEPRSLNQLVAVAARQVAACSGAMAAVWRGGEPAMQAATHPDLPALMEIQLASGRGPVLDAVAGAGPVDCPDTLEETRWPEYARLARRLGVRCSVTLAYQPGAVPPQPAEDAVILSLCGARPRSLAAGLAPAELLVAFGAAIMGNAAEYGDTRRAALQLRAAAQSRAVVDQAKGMLMQVLGCSAEAALDKMRQISQERNLRVTEVAQVIIDARGRLPGADSAGRA
jgi:hypothetical protein